MPCVERTPGVLLWPRAAVVGLLAAGLGVVGHVGAGGLLPGPGVVVALLAVSVALSAPALREQASARRLVGLLVLGQAWVHVVLTASAGHRDDPPTHAGHLPVAPTDLTVSPGSPGLAEHDGRRVGSLMDAYQAGLPVAPTGDPGLGQGAAAGLMTHVVDHAPMMAAHALAAALVALWLAAGERALWALLALTAGMVLALLRPPAPVPAMPGARRTAPTPEPSGPRPGRLGTSPLSRRGPPHLLEHLPTPCR